MNRTRLTTNWDSKNFSAFWVYGQLNCTDYSLLSIEQNQNLN